MKKPIRTGPFFTHADGKLSVVTSACTIGLKELCKGKFGELATHTGGWFLFDDGSVEYFEALMDKGWTGPEPIEKVVEWSKAHPKRRLRMYDMTDVCGFTADDVARRYEMALQRKDVWKYSKAQLGLHLRIARLFRRILGRSLFKPSVRSVICSECESQLLNNPPYFDVLRACAVPDFDLIDPAMLERVTVESGGQIFHYKELNAA